jgi:hypothetical protein
MLQQTQTLKERWTPGTTIDVFEVERLERLAEENKVDVAIKWECGFVIERIEWLNGFDPSQHDAKN